MIRKRNEEIEWLEFELLSQIPGLKHGVFLKGKEKLQPQTLSALLGLEEYYSGKQVHGCEVLYAGGKEPLSRECDGIITQTRGLALAIKHADCQAAIFYDPLKKAIGNVHSGWRGNVLNIYAEAVKKMRALFGSRPENLLVCISPSLGPEHAEFIHYQEEFPKHFWSYQVKPFYFDLWAIARQQLEEAGVLPSHIEIASLCTYAHPTDFFSYRRDKTQDRNITIVGLS